MVTKLETSLNEIREEYLSAKELFGPFNSHHEGYAVILEELDELWDEVKANKNKALMRKEAKHTAAMALRFMIDLTEDASLDTP